MSTRAARPSAFALVLGVLLPAASVSGIAVAPLSAGCARAEPTLDALPGIRLGMSPRDVRDRFDGGGPGSWQTRLGASPGEDTTLEWTARDAAAARAVSARFEFHLGMLVAVRASLREPVASEQVESTARTVTARKPAPSGSELVILARDCPTHRDEAESLASRSGRPRS